MTAPAQMLSCAGSAGADTKDAMEAVAKIAGERGVSMPRALVRLARPHQWIKNLLVLAPLVFAQRLFDRRSDFLAALALAAFCAMASATYSINDIADRDADRLHPEKRDRPLARGDLTVRTAGTFAAMLGAAALLAGLRLG